MAKNDPASVVAGAGLLTAIFTSLNAKVLAMGGTAEDIHRLTKPEGDQTLRLMAELIVTANTARAMRNHEIEDLSFSLRPYHCLKRVGIETVGDLVSRSENQLLSIPGFRQEDLDEVKEVLARHGLGLLGSTA